MFEFAGKSTMYTVSICEGFLFKTMLIKKKYKWKKRNLIFKYVKKAWDRNVTNVNFKNKIYDKEWPAEQ